MKKYNIEVFYDSDFDYDYIFYNMEEIGIEIHHKSDYILGSNNFCGDSVDYLLELMDFTDNQIEYLYRKFNTLYCNDCLQYLLERLEPKAILPVYIYEHSGSAISTTPFGCRWDSGQIGFIYVADKEKFKKAFGLKKMDNQKALDVMDSIIREINTIWNGGVYGFIVKDNESGEHIDSCGGFIGYDTDEIAEEMLGHVCLQNVSDKEALDMFLEAFDNIDY